MKSHYDTLDIHPDSSLAEIKKKFRALSLRFHPDLSKTKVSSNGEKFKQISAAYAVLSHKRDRKLYDLGEHFYSHIMKRLSDSLPSNLFETLNIKDEASSGCRS